MHYKICGNSFWHLVACYRYFTYLITIIITIRYTNVSSNRSLMLTCLFLVVEKFRQLILEKQSYPVHNINLSWPRYIEALTLQAMEGGRGVTVRPPPSLFFCPLLKISLGNPYLKIIDLTKLFIADASMKKKIKNFCLPPLRALWNMGPKTAHSRKG